jgi:hypothetical protein
MVRMMADDGGGEDEDDDDDALQLPPRLEEFLPTVFILLESNILGCFWENGRIAN